MNSLDLFLGFVILLFTLGGMVGGAVRRVVQVAAIVIAFREAWRIAPWVEQVLAGSDHSVLSGWGFLVPLLAFAVLYLAIRWIGSWFERLTKGNFLWVLDHLIGTALGLLVGIYILGYGCLMVEKVFPTAPYDERSQLPPTTRQDSYLYPRLIDAVADITEAKARFFSPSEVPAGDGADSLTEPPMNKL